jgi:hypothetical protein
MKFRELIEEFESTYNGEVDKHDREYFETDFGTDYTIDYDDDIPSAIFRRDKEKISGEDINTAKEWCEWWNSTNDIKVMVLSTDLGDLGINLAVK